MTAHKATPKQWAETEAQVKDYPYATESCLLELRARVEALEANAKPTPNFFQIGSSLVEQVAKTLGSMPENGLIEDWEPEARAAIREVAAWLDANSGGTRAAWMLLQEAERTTKQ
jgi:hypothetical protein